MPSNNNQAEREIRPAVLMTIFRTLKRRVHDPLQVMTNALRHFTVTGQLPPLPDAITSTG